MHNLILNKTYLGFVNLHCLDQWSQKVLWLATWTNNLQQYTFSAELQLVCVLMGYVFFYIYILTFKRL